MNVTFIGMAGAGKSFFGKRLAKRLTFDFVDIDEEMEKHYGKPLADLVTALGEADFIAREGEQSIMLTSGRDNLVVSPGGSIVYHVPAMDHLAVVSRIVYLEVPFETIEARMHGREGKIIGLGGMSLRDLYEERLPLYRSYAHLTIDATPGDPDEIERRITEGLMIE